MVTVRTIDFCCGAALAFLLAVGAAGCGERREARQEAAAEPRLPKTAPDVYRVLLDTSKGPVAIEVRKEWAPRGAERFYELVNSGYYNNARFYRVVRNYVAQFGFSGIPKVDALWQMAYIPDDPVKQSNRKGYVSFAQSGPATRSTQVFINLRDNKELDKSGFAPFGQVVEGMEFVEKLYYSYGDLPPRGYGPDPMQLGSQGNQYLEAKFPRLDYIKRAAVIQQAD